MRRLGAQSHNAALMQLDNVIPARSFPCRVFVKRKRMRTKYKEVIFVLLLLPSLLFTSTIASHVIYGKESHYCQRIYMSATHAVKVLSRNSDNCVLMFFFPLGCTTVYAKYSLLGGFFGDGRAWYAD